MGAMAEELRKKGKLVVGGSAYTDRLEDDRGFGQQELKAAGVPIIPQENFTSFDEAIAYVTGNPNRYVIKPSGEAQNEKALLFVGEEDDGRDVIQVLATTSARGRARSRNSSCSAAWSASKWRPAPSSTARSSSPRSTSTSNTRSSFPATSARPPGDGTSMFWSEPNRIFNLTLKKMEPRLAEERYTGYIDVNCIVNNNGVYRSSSPRVSAIPPSASSRRACSPDGRAAAQARRRLDDARARAQRLPARRAHRGAAFPFRDMETFESTSKDAVILFKTPNREGLHIEDVKTVDGEWLVTGTSGVVLICCGTGSTMKQAQRQAYNRVKNVMIPHMYYARTSATAGSRRTATACTPGAICGISAAACETRHLGKSGREGHAGGFSGQRPRLAC